jgi:hypothetical protein
VAISRVRLFITYVSTDSLTCKKFMYIFILDIRPLETVKSPFILVSSTFLRWQELLGTYLREL